MGWLALVAGQYLLAGLLVYVLLTTYSPPPEVEVPDLPAAFDGQQANAWVRALALEHPNRVTGTPEDEAAAAWMAEQMRGLGLEVSEQRFEVWNLDPFDQANPRFGGINVLGVSPGRADEAIVIGAHRDIVAETTQGAVDNASGSGSMLELARVLTGGPHHYTYVFASWGAEEVGLGGSRYYVGQASRPTALALSMDVTGLVERDKLSLIDWASLPLEAGLAVERMALEQQLVSGPHQRRFLSLLGLSLAEGGATDSSPFAGQGIPALGVGWDTPHFHIIHTRRDTIEHVDDHSLELTGRLAERLVRLAEVRAPAFLAEPPSYLRRQDGSIVPDIQTRLALAVVVLFALASPIIAAAQARQAGIPLGSVLRAHAPLLLQATVGAGVVVGLAWLLGLWSGPSPGRLVLWIAAVTLLLTPAAFLARRAAPQPPLARRLVLGGLVAVVFCATATFANPFLMAALLAYPLLMLPRLTFRRGWWMGLDTLLTLPWIGLAVALLSMSQTYASLLPEYAPAARVGLFQVLVALLLYASVALSLTPTRSAPAPAPRTLPR